MDWYLLSPAGLNRHLQLTAHVTSPPSLKIFCTDAPLPCPVYVRSVEGKKGAHFFWPGAHYIRVSLEANVINTALPWVTAFILHHFRFFLSMTECLLRYWHDGEIRDFKCEQLQERANKTSFLKLFKPWPPVIFPELMGGHQSRGTHVPCWSP